MSNLQKKIRAVEDEHAAEMVTNNLAKHDEASRFRALMVLGGVRAVDRVTQNLSSQVMNALIAFQKEDMHELLGYSRFADFLDQSEYSPMSKSDFYRRKEIFETEGAEIYDAFNSLKIPMSTRKLLANSSAGEISIDGNEIVIGDERADLSDLPTIKELIKTLADESRQLTETGEKNKKHFEKLKEQITTGQKEYDELRRSIDAAQTGTPYEQALMKAIGALIKLAIVANDTPIVEKDARGRTDIETLWKQMMTVRTALLQDDFAFTDEVGGYGKPISEIAKKVLAMDDDWGDQLEQ